MNPDNFDEWLTAFVKTAIPFEVRRKIIENEKLNEEEISSFLNVVVLADQARQFDEHSEILNRIDRNFAAQTEALRIATAIRNNQRRSMGLSAEPKRTQECDRWCYDQWILLRKRNDLIEPPIDKEKVFCHLCSINVHRKFLEGHGITEIRHFKSAVDNGRKCPRIGAE